MTVASAALVASLALPTQTPAVPSPDSRWRHLADTAPQGLLVTLTLADGSRLEGTLIDVAARALVLEHDDRRDTIPADRVVRVRREGERRSILFRSMGIGALAGAVGLLVIDQRSSHPSSAGEALGLGALFIGVPAGAIVGAFIPLPPALYDAPPRRAGQP